MSNDVTIHEPRPSVSSGGTPRALVPTDIEGVWRVAQLLAASGMTPTSVKSAEQISVAIMHGLEIGLTPMQSVQSIAVVNGRPTIWGDAALALVRASGLMESFSETSAGEGDKFEAICTVMRKGEKYPIVGKFSVSDAKISGLWTKTGRDGQKTPWQLYPKRMLQVRARGFALRDAFPDVLKGLAIKEEIDDVEAMRDVTRRNIAPPPPDEIQNTAPASAVSKSPANVDAGASDERSPQTGDSSEAKEIDQTDWKKVIEDFAGRLSGAKTFDTLEEERDFFVAIDQLPRAIMEDGLGHYEAACNALQLAEDHKKKKAAAAANGKAGTKPQADQAPPPPADGDFPGETPAQPEAKTAAPPPPTDNEPSPEEMDAALVEQGDENAMYRQTARERAKMGTRKFNMWWNTISDDLANMVAEMPDYKLLAKIMKNADKALAEKAAAENSGA